jgi:hypothetical protein
MSELNKEEMKEMARVFFMFKKQGLHVSFKEVAEVTFFDFKTDERSDSKKNLESLIEQMFDKTKDRILNEGYLTSPAPYIIHEGKYLDFREDYSDEYIVNKLMLGKMKRVIYYER